MIEFNSLLQRFEKQGEKTGWTYIAIPADIADQLKPGNKKSFRVKGKLDNHKIEGVALLPMGGGEFIMAVNAAMRKAIGKRMGAMIRLKLQEDTQPFKFNKDFMACLRDEPAALNFFNSLAGSHQRYFSKWIDDARTTATQTKRIALAINALSRKQGFPEMLRAKQRDNI